MGEAPRPRSPPRYPDLCGRRRLQLEVHILNREVGFLEMWKQLKGKVRRGGTSSSTSQPSSGSDRPDPFLGTTPNAQRQRQLRCLVDEQAPESEVVGRPFEEETEAARQPAEQGVGSGNLKARKGTDPDRPEQLIDEGAMEKMAKYAEYFKRSHGDDVDFLKEPLDVAVAYDAGGGLPHGRIGLGDGYVDREAYSRRRSSSASSSRSQSTAETNELKEQLRRTQEQMQQMQQQMQYLMMAQFLAGGSTGSQFGMPQQSQGSESGQAYIPPPQGFMAMLGASRSGGQASTGVLPQMPPFGPWWQTPPAPFPPPAAGSRQGTTDGDIFLNLSGGGASGGGSNHDMAMD